MRSFLAIHTALTHENSGSIIFLKVQDGRKVGEVI